MGKGVLLVLSGFSGAGKGTIVKKLITQYDGYALSVSATTRQPREGEVHGREYFFLTKEEFEDLIAKNQLLEYAQYQDNYYGTPEQFVRDQMAAGKNMILEIDSQGAVKIKEKFPEAVMIFVAAPSVDELYRRLSSRGTETEEKVMGRMKLAYGETARISNYDYLIINDDLDKAVQDVHSIVTAEALKPCDHEAFVQRIEEEFKEFLKGE